MALVDLLYRCVVCVQDPVAGDRDLVTCPASGARFERAAGSARVRTTGAGGPASSGSRSGWERGEHPDE